MSKQDHQLPAAIPCLGAIWAQTSAGVIGRDGTMPWYAPEDLAHFKAVTVGKPVIMGRRTWESFPSCFRPLPERTNIVISRSAPLDSKPVERDGAFWVSSLDAALTLAGNTPLAPNATQHPDSPHQRVTAWIIGGGSIYVEALSREDLPVFGRVEIIERTLLASLEDAEITGDTYAPKLTTEELSRTNKPVQWGALNQSIWERSENGYLLGSQGKKHPMKYSFQTLART
jgi:dihydrofolate reductase